MENNLFVSEMFYSIQGEGLYSGKLAIFLRLGGCNLRCKGFSYIDPKTKKHLGCDTKLIWRQGQKYTYQEIYQYWVNQGWIIALKKGAHLVLTGGEPLLQQDKLMKFIDFLDNTLEFKMFLELETNGTILINNNFLSRLNHINVSPKLLSSGELNIKAYRILVLKQLAAEKRAFFKFVLVSPQDIMEVIAQYVSPFAIPNTRVFLMPEGATRKDLLLKQVWVVDS